MKRAMVRLLIGSASLLVLSGVAQSQNFECEDNNGFRVATFMQQDVKDHLRSSYPREMHRVATWYVDLWDAQEMRRVCEAVASDAAPRSAISCLSGQRDWGAIDSMIPADLAGASLDVLGAHRQGVMSEAKTQSKSAYQYCRDVGAIR